MTEDKSRRIVFTGASGGIGTMTRPFLAQLYPGLVRSAFTKVSPGCRSLGSTLSLSTSPG